MLQLRTPKLSERLDPSLLSTLLSRALPPLGDAEIAELAEGFERLDRQREELGRLDDEVAAADRPGRAAATLRPARAARGRGRDADLRHVRDGRPRPARAREQRRCAEHRRSRGRAGPRPLRAGRTHGADDGDRHRGPAVPDGLPAGCRGAASARRHSGRRPRKPSRRPEWRGPPPGRPPAGHRRRRHCFHRPATAAWCSPVRPTSWRNAGLRAADRARLGTVHAEVGELALG